ncbi:dtw domain protein [Cystoisospora suis]|uniref:tRNA-uridine aminocarboxypropyltransferase n=1 Tax=Cystoisospora suis TaxID=483139 RepID=A0A2C6KTL3_9APIC|nr:dtw domain protein [Cystoisospora suis]
MVEVALEHQKKHERDGCTEEDFHSLLQVSLPFCSAVDENPCPLSCASNPPGRVEGKTEERHQVGQNYGQNYVEISTNNATETVTERRVLCSGCGRPLRVCYCHVLPRPRVNLSHDFPGVITGLVVYVHPLEAKRKMGSLPLLQRAIEPVHTFIQRKPGTLKVSRERARNEVCEQHKGIDEYKISRAGGNGSSPSFSDACFSPVSSFLNASANENQLGRLGSRQPALLPSHETSVPPCEEGWRPFSSLCHSSSLSSSAVSSGADDVDPARHGSAVVLGCQSAFVPPSAFSPVFSSGPRPSYCVSNPRTNTWVHDHEVSVLLGGCCTDRYRLSSCLVPSSCSTASSSLSSSPASLLPLRDIRKEPNNLVLLYPTEWSFELGVGTFPLRLPLTLLCLDGTWREVKEMLHSSPWLNDVPAIKLPRSERGFERGKLLHQSANDGRVNDKAEEAQRRSIEASGKALGQRPSMIGKQGEFDVKTQSSVIDEGSKAACHVVSGDIPTWCRKGEKTRQNPHAALQNVVEGRAPRYEPTIGHASDGKENWSQDIVVDRPSDGGSHLEGKSGLTGDASREHESLQWGVYSSVRTPPTRVVDAGGVCTAEALGRVLGAIARWCRDDTTERAKYFDQTIVQVLSYVSRTQEQFKKKT